MLWCGILRAANTDSLLRVYTTAPAFKTRFNAGYELVFLLRFNDKPKAKRIARTLLADKRVSQYPENHAWLWIRLGIVYDLDHKPDSAILCNEQALLLAKQHGKSKPKAGALSNLGLIYWNYNQLDKATVFITQSLAEFEKNGDTLDCANTLNNLGLIMYDLDKKAKARMYYHQALRLFIKGKNAYGIGSALHNLSYAHTNIDSAWYYNYKAARYQQQSHDDYGLAKTYHNMALLHDANPDSALYYYTLAIAHQEKAGNLYGQVSTLGAIADYLLKHGHNKNEALGYALKSRKMAKEIGDIRYLWRSEGILGTIYLAQGDYKNAANHLLAALYAKDSTVKEEIFTSSQQLEFKYNTAQKEKLLAQQKADIATKQTLLLKGESERKTIWIILVITAFTAVLLFYLYTRKQASVKQASLKLKLAQQEALNKIQDDRLRISRELHDNIGSYLTLVNATIEQFQASGQQVTEAQLDVMKGSLLMSMKELRKTVWLLNKSAVSLDEIVLKLRDFLSPVQQNGIQVKVSAVGDMQQKLTEIATTHLFRIIQESVSNAVRHSGCNAIAIVLESRGKTIAFSIADNGKGFDTTISHTGNGLHNLGQRAARLNATLHISSKPGMGATINGEFINPA